MRTRLVRDARCVCRIRTRDDPGACCGWLEACQSKGHEKRSPFGRPRVKPAVERDVLHLRAQDWGVNRIARKLGIGSGTVRRIVARSSIDATVVRHAQKKREE